MKRILLCLTIVLLICTGINFLANFFVHFDVPNEICYPIDESNVPLYNFKGMQVDENENIFVGTKQHIVAYNSSGKVLGIIHFVFDNYSFIIDGDDLVVATDRNIENDEYGNMYETKADTVYFYKYSISDWLNDKYCHYYNTYYDENLISSGINIISSWRTKDVKINNKNYEYKFYGKVLVNNTETIKLQAPKLPLANSLLLIVDLCLIVAYIIAKISLKIKEKKQP